VGPEHHENGRWEGLREVFRMAWPIMLGAISFTVMDFVDKVFVSRLGEDNLAAVGSAGIWSYTLGVFFLGIAGCVSTFAAQSLGRGNTEDCARYAWQGIYISFASGIAALGLWPLADELFGLMGHSPEVTRLEIVYFRVRLFGYVFIAWQGALAAFFQAVNRPIVPMYVSLVANALNVLLDWLLIFPHGSLLPGWGIAGAGVATVVSLAVQVALLQAVFLGPSVNKAFTTRQNLRFNRAKFRDLLRIGWPAGVSSFLDVASWSIFTSFLVGRFATFQLAAHTAAISIMHLTFIPALALNFAITAIVGQWVGRGNIAVAKARTYTTVKVCVFYMVTVGVLIASVGDTLMGVFSSDPAIIELGHTLLILAAIFAGFDAVAIVVNGALRGAGDTRWLMWALFIGSYFVQLPLAYFFSGPFGLEAQGAWIGATIYVILISGVVFMRFKGEKWRHIKIFSEASAEGEPANAPSSADPETDLSSL